MKTIRLYLPTNVPQTDPGDEGGLLRAEQPDLVAAPIAPAFHDAASTADHQNTLCLDGDSGSLHLAYSSSAFRLKATLVATPLPISGRPHGGILFVSIKQLDLK